ncbi:MG2 domain-containing protein [Ideonella sp. DXS22W]|uniref:MG2 domain-containing protein n=1 Tax=Pseudaquabacterium inlustre TaxID=2984192 RepID=A0ABU9CN36_9BURK
MSRLATPVHRQAPGHLRVRLGLGLAWLGALSMLCVAPAQAAPARQPRIAEVRPFADTAVGERPVFALRPAAALSGPPRAVCDVWGVRSEVPVQVVTGAERREALRSLGIAQGDAEGWITLRCQTRLPDGTAASLRWLNPVRTPELPTPGIDTWQGQRFDYTVRGRWPLAVLCNRSNAASGCNPLEPVRLQFTQPVQRGDLAGLRLRGADGRTVRPTLTPAGNDALAAEVLDQIEFPDLKANQRYTVQWPARLRGGQGDDLLAGVRSRPADVLAVQMGPLPPLAKFGADFGIAERALGGVVPITVRGVEGKPQGSQVLLRTLRIADEAAIVEALQTLGRLQQADDSHAQMNGEFEGDAAPAADASPRTAPARFPFKLPQPRDGADGSAIDTRAVSWLRQLPGHRQQPLPRREGAAQFEVLGIPLGQPGLHLLEVESRLLGRGLLDGAQPMQVRAGALVTDLAVHLHLGQRGEHAGPRQVAVWVTRLTNARVVTDAAITLRNCRGQVQAQGRSNADGWVTLNLPNADAEDWSCPLYAFAREGDDLGLASSRWQRGIESWRFEQLASLMWGDGGSARVHAVLARNLLRPGETLHARLFWRQLDARGALALPPAGVLPAQASLVHLGSGERRSLPLRWDARGTAEIVWPLPEGFKRGAWQIEAGPSVTGGQFRVEEFRLPVLKAQVLSPPGPLMVDAAGSQAPVGLRLDYLSGGPAAGESVRVSQSLQRHVPQFEAWPGWQFGLADAQDSLPAPSPEQTLRIAADGTARIDTPLPAALPGPQWLVTEMEYRDPNGETYRAQGRSVVWPSAVVLGIKTPGWQDGPVRQVELLALDPQGQPQAGVPLRVKGGFDGWLVHRRRAIGGLYSWVSERMSGEMKPLCEGRSGADGRFVCALPAAAAEIDSGEFRVEAEASDRAGRASRAGSTLWLYNGGEVWTAQSDHDRMDVLVEAKRWRPGEVATLQVRSPFREGRAWVNLMRAGRVIDTLVLPMHGSQPTIALPIKPAYAPNVFVNVLAVRGRVAEPPATALVDLARPAYKLGLAHLDVDSSAQALAVSVATDRPRYQTRDTATVRLQVAAPDGPLPAGRSATVFVIDEALLELLPNDSWALLPSMLRRHGYGFETASAAMQVIGRRHYGRKALPPGGGGGRSPTRELFDTLLAWHGSVALDAQGRAELKVPINDSLTRFRVVAVAEAGGDRFGTGSASFTVTRDLQLSSGLPLLLREGDSFAAGFTLRNATDAPLQASVTARVDGQPLPPQRLSLAPQASQRVVWRVPVAAGARTQAWQVEASADTPAGPRRDALAVQVPVDTPLDKVAYTVATAQRLGTAGLSLPVQPPAGAVPGRGELLLSLAPTVVADPGPVRAYMRDYPFVCLEQRTSKAVALKDPALWRRITDSLDQYLDSRGLAAYYPQGDAREDGSLVLTAFVLSAAHEAGYTLPDAPRQRMLQALRQFAEGKLAADEPWAPADALALTERKLLALEALARHGQPPATLADSLKLDADTLPRLGHRALVQWLDLLQRASHWPQRDARQQPALAELNRRLVDDGRGGLRLRARDDDQRWWWMYSADVAQVRLAALALRWPALAERTDALALGAEHLQAGGGHWATTQANVWGSLLLDQRAAQAVGRIAGTTRVQWGTQTLTHDWQAQPQGATLRLAVPATPKDAAPGAAPAVPPAASSASAALPALRLTHEGRGQPVASAAGLALVPVTQPQARGVTVTRSVAPVKQAVPGQWTAGDVAEVTLRFTAPRQSGWLVLSDAIPPGATVLGSGLGGQAELNLTRDAQRGWQLPDGSWQIPPAYLERGSSHLRAYYRYLWGEAGTLRYQLRLNNAGQFALPPTRFEAMYEPDQRAVLPQPPLEVK